MSHDPKVSMRGEHLDLSSDPPDKRPDPSPATSGRKFLGVHFACCEVYGRIYLNRHQTAYAGNCPRCAKRLVIRVGPGGTDQRFFTAY